MKMRGMLWGFLGLLLVSGAPRAVHGAEEIPEAVRGFSGQVRGVVRAKDGDEAIDFHVARVVRVWRNSRARTPEQLAGHTVRVIAHREGGRAAPLQTAFLRGLAVGNELTLEIRNVEGPRNFQILELSAEQREQARRENGGREDGGGNGEDVSPARLRERLAVLEREVRRLRTENEALRQRLGQR